MSLLKKVKARLSQKVTASKEQRQRKQLNEAALQKDLEKARWEGRRKGLIQQARKESYRQAKTKPSGSGFLGTLGNVGARANAGLNFMNQDFGTAFSGKTKPQHTTEHHGETEKGVTIHVDGTTIHVGKKQQKKTPQQKRTVRKKKPKNTMFDLF